MSTVEIESSALQQAVAWAGVAIPSRSTTPVLSACVLESDADGLHVSGFDLEASTSMLVEPEIGELPRTLVNGQTLRSVVEQLDAVVKLTLDGPRLEIRSGRARFRLPTIAPDYYPATPKLPDAIGTMEADHLRELMSRVSVACTVDQTVPVLAACLLVAGDGAMTAYATDRYRLHVGKWPWQGQDNEALVMGRRFAELTKSMAGNVEVLCDANVIGLSDGRRTATLNLLGAEYPKVSMLLDKDTGDRVVVARDDLARSIKAAAVVSTGKQPHVDLAITEDTVTVSATGDDSGQSDIALNADSTAERALTLNADYTIDALGALHGSHVELWLPQMEHPPVTMFGLPNAEATERHQAMRTMVMSVRKKDA